MATELPGFNEPFSARDRVVDGDGTASTYFTRFMNETLVPRIGRSAYRVSGPPPQTDLQASGLAVLIASATAGQYRISVYREVVVADPVSSSLAIVIGFTHNTKALLRTLAAFAGAPQTANDNAGDTVVIDVDAGTPITYTATYASNTPGVARFYLSLTPELVQVEQ